MAELPIDGFAVLSGEATAELRWVVSVDATDGHLLVMLNVVRGGQCLSGSGFDDAPHFGDTVLHEWRGRHDDLPWFVMARTAGVVTRVVATTDRGTDVELKLSPIITEYGSRFAAAGLPEGERPSTIRAEHDGVVIASAHQRVWALPSDGH
jgi:hypothetical protein